LSAPLTARSIAARLLANASTVGEVPTSRIRSFVTYRSIHVVKAGMMLSSRRPEIEPAPASQESIMATTDAAEQNLIVTAFWEVNAGEEGAVAALLKDFLPQAQREPGVREFQIHQNVAKPREFFFYEVFAGEAAFADHQETDHFKSIIVGQAVPKLAKRERQQFRFI
jgi:quinol monooxygenase YgiN